MWLSETGREEVLGLYGKVLGLCWMSAIWQQMLQQSVVSAWWVRWQLCHFHYVRHPLNSIILIAIRKHATYWLGLVWQAREALVLLGQGFAVR